MSNHKPSAFEKLLLNKTCLISSKGIALQCAREYWGAEDKPRFTELFKLNKDQLLPLPTDNVNTEHHLAKFGYLASLSAAHSNKNFKAKRIRDDMMFDEINTTAADLEIKNKPILNELKEMEVHWTDQQKQEKRDYVLKSLESHKKTNLYINEVLEKCKSHGGPINSIQDLKA